MSLRRRMVGAVSAVTLVTLGGAFTAIDLSVNAAQQRQLDEALRAEAEEEAHEASDLGGDHLAISDRPGPAANDVGPLTKYGAIYAADGRVLAATPTFHGSPPKLSALQRRDGEGFDLWFDGEHLRGILTAVPNHLGYRLLLAAPRADLDGDAAFLFHAMAIVFVIAVGWVVVVAMWLVRRLTREHGAIMAVARRVAAGDLSARVASRGGDPEIVQLARDIDDMIERLSLLMASQHRFIAHAAHELRSPLTTLYGELSHALRRSRDVEAYRASIEEALDSCRRLKLIAEDLLALARIGADAREPDERIGLTALLQAGVEAVAWEAKERDVRIDVRDLDVSVSGRPHDLERLLRNVIENALRHSPRGGVVEVMADVRQGEVEVSVSDDGPGVPDADRERIFEPFYRGARERASDVPGTGLGLTIAREVARAHGGDVFLTEPRDPTRGARFIVRLPALSATS